MIFHVRDQFRGSAGSEVGCGTRLRLRLLLDDWSDEWCAGQTYTEPLAFPPALAKCALPTSVITSVPGTMSTLCSAATCCSTMSEPAIAKARLAVCTWEEAMVGIQVSSASAVYVLAASKLSKDGWLTGRLGSVIRNVVRPVSRARFHDNHEEGAKGCKVGSRRSRARDAYVLI